MPASPVARVRRLGGYAFWSAAAFGLPVGLDRLIVCPVLQVHLGEDVFGGFVWLLGIVNVFGLATGAGFSNFLMRDLSRQTEDGARCMLRTTLTLSAVLSFVVIPVGGFASYWIADEVVRARPWVLYVPLCLFGLVRCVEWILIANLRIKRLFATVFVLKAVEGAVLLTVLFAAPGRSLGLIGAIYVASVVAPLVLAGFLSRRDIGRGSWCDRPAASRVMHAWPGLTLSALIEHSLVYSPRIVLGAITGSAAVTVLFAGASIGNVFVMPVGMAGGLILALLAAKQRFALAGRRGFIYLGLCLATSAAVGVGSYLAGRPLVTMLYPKSAAETLTFYHWIAFANACAAAIVLIRPVVLKYARIRYIAGLSTATLALQLVALSLLVPAAGARGAAIGLAMSSVLAMILWLGCYARLMWRARHDGGAGDADPGAAG